MYFGLVPVVWLLALLVVGWAARYKGRSLLGWLVATFVFGPLAVVLLLLVLPRAGTSPSRQAA
jgi:hypothetical protein